MGTTELEYDRHLGGAFVINESDVADEDVYRAINDVAPELAALSRWSVYNQGRSRNSQGGVRYQTLFDRDRFVNPDTIFEKFRTATDAAENDDVVSGVVETTEQLAFKRVAMETADAGQQSVWNQICDDLDLSQRMREIWRELFIVSQCYVAVLYGRKSYKVKGKNMDTGAKRKKEYQDLIVPKAISLLDPLKVIPVGNFLFNQEQLIYIADPSEAVRFDETLADANSTDLVVSQLLQGRYEPSQTERSLIAEITGVNNYQDFFLLNPRNVFRITATRPQYKRFAPVRMESVFELLDLKHQLRQMDRSALIGSTNAIILVKKGDKDKPAKAEEIKALAAQIGGTARQPVIVGDHRIEIEIITPKTDKTLAAERYNALDSRITSRLFQILSSGNYASGTATDNSAGLMRVVASSMEARRDNIRDALMNKIFDRTFEDNDALDEEPTMGFYPRRIALDFDPTIATYLQTLRDRGDISRETILAELDILEDDELVKRQREADYYDEHFTPPNNVPFDGNHIGPEGEGEQKKPTNKADQKAAGRAGGGNNNGGGTNPASTAPSSTAPKSKS